MLVLLGALHVVQGVAALAGHFSEPGLLFATATAWGWAHVVLGVVAGLAGLGLLAGTTWARVLGVVLALLSAVGNLAVAGAFPVASGLLLVVDVLVVYAITVHGGELRARSYG